jgi:acyl-CoA thioesterase
VAPGFREATAVAPAGDDRWRGEIHRGWRGGGGPHGGYVAAIVVRALEAAAADPERPLRSLTLHFLAPPAVGPVDVVVRTERTGRSLSSLSARLEQDGTTCGLALAAFSKPRETPEYDEDGMPEVPPPGELQAYDVAAHGGPEFFGNVEVRPAIGGFVGAGAPEVGGWIRPAEGGPVDAAAAAFLLDAWWPAAYPRLSHPAGAPTVDLTIHFRRALPATADGEPLLARFISKLLHDGFFEEDGELWAPDGRLLAQSRQLAIVLPDANRLPGA